MRRSKIIILVIILIIVYHALELSLVIVIGNLRMIIKTPSHLTVLVSTIDTALRIIILGASRSLMPRIVNKIVARVG